jgi:hypothetical protein
MTSERYGLFFREGVRRVPVAGDPADGERLTSAWRIGDPRSEVDPVHWVVDNGRVSEGSGGNNWSVIRR